MKKLPKLLLALSALAVAAGASAQVKPEDAIKYRKAGYSYMSWNMGKIKEQTIDNPAAYNKDQVLAAARTIAAIANSGMGALYVAGSDKDAGGQKTRVKPEFFQQQEEVGKIARAFNAEANKLAEVAAGGDVNAIKAQFGKTGETCKSCHDKFRMKD